MWLCILIKLGILIQGMVQGENKIISKWVHLPFSLFVRLKKNYVSIILLHVEFCSVP